MTPDQINTLFNHYPVFRLGRIVQFIAGKFVVRQSAIIGVLFSILIVAGSVFERTLFLKVRDVGLLEHPTIWAFLIIQLTVTFFVMKSVEKLFAFLKRNDVIEKGRDLSNYASLFKSMVARKNNFSRFSFAFLTLIGVICFAWNSFQNQQPYRFLGFDFWDSYNHPFGYWSSRLHKLYLWGFFLPAIIHIHICVLYVLHKLLKDAKKDKFFMLQPYNQDEHAGVGEIIKIAINPPLPILLIGSFSVLGAFFIHGQIGVTPVVGLSILTLLFLVVYLIPAIQLRSIIKFEKKRQLIEVADKQNLLYVELVKKNNKERDQDNLETLNSLTTVFDHVKSIPIWPYWKRIVWLVGMINFPVLVSLGKALWPMFKDRFF